MNKKNTLVFCGAHPDDESYGVGSTLAQYAAAGVKVYYVCSTGGEAGTVDPKFLRGYATIKDLRLAELKCAAQVLGLAGVIELGYRDSDMRGSESNKHPDALAMAPIDEIAKRIVKIIRDIKPEVIITHDSSGGYGHPDHIGTHNATVKAFQAAGDVDGADDRRAAVVDMVGRGHRQADFLRGHGRLRGGHPHSRLAGGHRRSGPLLVLDGHLPAGDDEPGGPGPAAGEADHGREPALSGQKAAHGPGANPGRALHQFMGG